MIFVLDSNDKDRMDSNENACDPHKWSRTLPAKIELHSMLKDEELDGAVLLVLANKQDLSSMKIQEVEERLELKELKKRKWHVQPTCALTGQGLEEGLEWLAEALTDK